MDRTARPSARSNRCPLPCSGLPAGVKMPAGIWMRVPNSGTSKLRHPKGPPARCAVCGGREFSLGAKATLYFTSLPFFCSAAGVGRVGVDPSSVRFGLGRVATRISAPTGLSGCEENVGCEDGSVRPELFWTSRACVSTGPSLVLTLAEVEVISARRGKSGSGLKPVAQMHRAVAVKSVTIKMPPFLLPSVGTATSDCLDPSMQLENGSAFGTTLTARIQSRSS